MALLNRFQFPRSARDYRRAAIARRMIATMLLGSLAWLAGGFGTPLRAEVAASKEHQVKAVFLFNFIQFTMWPDTAFADAAAPVRIGIVGDDPFAGALEAVVRGETVGGRSVVVQRFPRAENARDCHAVFVSKSETARIPSIVSTFARQPVLTVGDMPDFARRGGVINFYLEGQKVRFEINRAAAQASGIKLSSQLLGLARIVEPAGGMPDR